MAIINDSIDKELGAVLSKPFSSITRDDYINYIASHYIAFYENKENTLIHGNNQYNKTIITIIKFNNIINNLDIIITDTYGKISINNISHIFNSITKKINNKNLLSENLSLMIVKDLSSGKNTFYIINCNKGNNFKDIIANELVAVQASLQYAPKFLEELVQQALVDIVEIQCQHIGQFTLYSFPGCCGLQVLTNLSVNIPYRSQKLSYYLTDLATNISQEMGYTGVIATDKFYSLYNNVLLKSNFVKISDFKNQRTKNMVNIYHKNLLS